MSFYISKTIIFAYLVLQLIGTDCIKAEEQPDELKEFSPRSELSDLTKGLSDEEIEAALSDLSLSDLYALNKLIDASNAADDDYDEDTFLNSNANPRFLPMKYHNTMAKEEDDAKDYDDGVSNTRDQQAYQQSNLVEVKDSLVARADNSRLKRGSSHQTPQKAIHVDEEYLKQLENSFPRDQDQNEHEYSEEKKEHVRVKRH